MEQNPISKADSRSAHNNEKNTAEIQWRLFCALFSIQIHDLSQNCYFKFSPVPFSKY
jgi:hypothetical protein